MGACGEPGAPVLACGDDARGTAASTLVLTDVPAQDYLIVVDGYDPVSGAFELAVEVE